ncbi:COG4223 family protein [Nitrobacter sp. JJSN]|uniref:COG4223 family protein n=1 Tax=Nitrobacter sp. JJSN TaxID=3453033 RepID=UPI003F75C4E6
MADDRHDDASQEGSSQKHSPATDIETTETLKTADHAGSGLAGGAADDRRDDASQEGSWQSHSSAADPDANRISGTGDTGSGDVGGAVDDQQPVGGQLVSPPPRSRALSAVIAAITGAIAAGLVVGGAWLADWPPSSSSAPQVSGAQFSDLSDRVASVESKAGKPVASALDPAAAARIDALEKSVASLRGELATVRGQSDKQAAALKEGAAAPHDADETSDLAALSARLAQVEHQVEQTTQTLTSEATKHDTAPADNVSLRRAVAATLLNVSVRQGQPYGDLLAASKALIADPDTLKPLEAFADSGVPSANVLCRELLAIVPKLAPAPTPVMATTGSSIVNRLQEGAARLVRIERLDGSHTESASATVARIAASARQNDVVAAKAELNSLPPADRTAAELWITKADAHDAALAASHQFAVDAMAALTKPAQ